MAEQLNTIDAAARVSHRHLAVALALVLLLGAAGLLGVGAHGSGNILWSVMPVAITVAVVSLRSMGRHIDAKTMDAMRADELRQASLQRAWRNGFFAVSGLQPALALALTWTQAGHPLVLMAAASATLGTATVLASLLWYDR